MPNISTFLPFLIQVELRWDMRIYHIRSKPQLIAKRHVPVNPQQRLSRELITREEEEER